MWVTLTDLAFLNDGQWPLPFAAYPFPILTACHAAHVKEDGQVARLLGGQQAPLDGRALDVVRQPVQEGVRDELGEEEAERVGRDAGDAPRVAKVYALGLLRLQAGAGGRSRGTAAGQRILRCHSDVRTGGLAC